MAMTHDLRSDCTSVLVSLASARLPAWTGHVDADHADAERSRFKFAPYGGDFVFEGQLVPYDKPLVGMFLSNYAFSGRVIGGQFNGQTVTFGEHNPY
jgi:hypothetical protein